MKSIIAVILVLVTIDVFSQGQLPPIYYLNSVEVDIENVYIKPSSIDEMVVDKKTERGALYMKTKQPLTFVTLDMILGKYSDIVDSVNQVVYIINDKIVTDKLKIKVDESFFVQLEIKRLDKVNYINEGNRNLILVNIQLLNDKPKPVIRIRGEETAQTMN